MAEGSLTVPKESLYMPYLSVYPYVVPLKTSVMFTRKLQISIVTSVQQLKLRMGIMLLSYMAGSLNILPSSTKMLMWLLELLLIPQLMLIRQ